jgi:tetratricopeptide (TPR) repeat protein
MRPQLPLLVSLLQISLSGSVIAGSALAQEPTDALKLADADYREGVAALNRNELQTAQSKFESVVRLAPKAEQGHAALGAVLVREGQWSAGTRELEKALAIMPGDGAAQLNLAMVYAETGESKKAIPLFSKLQASAAAEKHPLAASVLSAYARAQAATGQTSAAITTMHEAVAQDARNPELHDELGTLYALKEDWEPAERQFSEAIRLKDGFATAHLHLGFVYQAEQKPEAASELMRAYEIAPDDASIALAVGKALGDAGNDERAAPILEHAVELDQKSPAAAYQLALVLQRINRVQEAIGLLNVVVEKEPENTDALVNLGMALSQAHQAADAVPYLQRAIKLDPSNTTAHQNLAAAYLQINRIDDAIPELKAAIKLSPDLAQVHYDLGVAYKLQDDAEDAIPELEIAKKLSPSGYEPAYVLGLLYMQVARYPEAAQQLEIALKLHPENGEGWATLGSVYNKLDRLPEAAAALREAIRQLPDQADSHLILATVLARQNQPAEAADERKVAANLMRVHMNLQRAQVASNSGKSLLAQGKVDEAIVEFRNALAFDPEFAEAHEGLADAFEKQGKTVEAAAERAQAKSRADSAH